ncbi:hypothetical protein [Agrobacterium pusense]|uniref:hypothetical protein n=1 Tax=Agrobacterium pusense TaxID=648995 RepID=UPI0005142C06|nr:hypothetical protein [Agrobacterium pusense]KGE80137.1 hypothetical protein LW14_24800 [Rhizobium sp. H41]QWW74697.1 hypothetical protein KP800_04235 [Agrobacterium pusense]
MLTSRVVRKVFVNVPSVITGPKRVKVGFPAGEADGGVIERAVWQEFGTRRGIPERPFMRNAMRANQSKYRNALKASAAKILRGEASLPIVMAKLGIAAQGDIQAEITSLMTPPLAPSTIAKKGSSKPLIDTGEMRGAVTFKVDG